LTFSLLAIAAVVASSYAGAQQPKQGSPVATTQERIANTGKRGFLYLATRGEHRFYLYGAAVASNDALFPFNSALVEALRQSQFLIVDREPDWPVAEAIAEGTLPPTQSLSLLLSPIMLGLVREALGVAGIDASPTERLKPWLVAESLAQAQIERTGQRADHATVRILLTYARNAGMQVRPLEPADADIRVLNSMPMEVQIARLTQVLGDLNTERGERAIRLYTDSWASGEMSGLEHELAMVQEPQYSAFTQWYWVGFHPQHMQRLADAILQALPPAGTVLVAVPALDLVGPPGLLKILESKGFKLRNLQP
jgi:uncharacterized protein YbaP (TraB family)